MDYEQKYKDALERASGFRTQECKDVAEYIFPELKESEDERIRKWIISDLKDSIDSCAYCERTKPQALEAIAWLEKQGKHKDYYTKQELIDMGFSFTLNGDIVTPDKVMEDMKKYLAWKEKQGEKKPNYTVEPKFKVGDWIISKYMHLVMQILNNNNGFYKTFETDGTERNDSYDFIECNYKLWTIQDAEDGDVLAFKNNIGGIIICKSPTYYNTSSYCRLTSIISDNFIYKEESGWDSTSLVPATKEQRNLLFANMKENGYEWDSEKKELKLIEKVDSFDAELNALLKKYEHLPKDELQKSLEFYLDVVDLDVVMEEKQKWTEEDDENLQHCCGAVASADYYSLKEREEMINWLKSLEQRLDK